MSLMKIKKDPVSNLNKLMVEVQIRVRKDDSNFYVIERKVGSEMEKITQSNSIKILKT